MRMETLLTEMGVPLIASMRLDGIALELFLTFALLDAVTEFVEVQKHVMTDQQMHLAAIAPAVGL